MGPLLNERKRQTPNWRRDRYRATGLADATHARGRLRCETESALTPPPHALHMDSAGRQVPRNASDLRFFCPPGRRHQPRPLPHPANGNCTAPFWMPTAPNVSSTPKWNNQCLLSRRTLGPSEERHLRCHQPLQSRTTQHNIANCSRIEGINDFRATDRRPSGRPTTEHHKRSGCLGAPERGPHSRLQAHPAACPNAA